MLQTPPHIPYLPTKSREEKIDKIKSHINDLFEAPHKKEE